MHSHNHPHHHDHGHSAGKNLAFAFWLNTGFAIIELIGGLFTNSVAIMSDALHDLGDSLALGTAWYFERKAKGKRDETYTYGYKRFSFLGALINAGVLTIGSVFILTEAVKRLFNPSQPDADGMIILAVFGVVVNGFALLRLRKGNSVNEKMISLHFIEDVLGWVAVLVGSIIIKFTDAFFIDPLLSVLIACFILFNVYRNMRGAFQVILQGVPHNVSEERVREVLNHFQEIESTHDLHLWTMDGTYNILTTHIVLHHQLEINQLEMLKTNIKNKLKEIHIQHATIEFEIKGLSCEQEFH